RAVASTWSLQYLWALLPPLAAAASVLQHVFPAAAADMALTVDTEGLPLRFYISHEGESAQDADTLTRYDALLFQHLEPLFACISEQANLPRKILWGNAARYLEIVLEQALVATGGSAVVADDKDTLLQQPHWSAGRRNPFHAHQCEVLLHNEGRCETIRLHRQCCLTHLLPAERHCTACPLAPQHQPGFA
ncbi:MAG TPA: siderophore-iron reductase FhuF, partial [Dongiaceae bacterium]|nr:siderophore-iron reductase FhuF [Dongiaceae bacterium]